MAFFRLPGLSTFLEEVFQCCVTVLAVDVKYIIFNELQSLSSQLIQKSIEKDVRGTALRGSQVSSAV